MKVLRVRVGAQPEVIDISPTLTEMQRLVGGYIRPLGVGDGIDLYMDEEGALTDKPVNFVIPAVGTAHPTDIAFVVYTDPNLARPGEPGQYVIRGDVFFARDEKSLTEEDLTKLLASFSWR